MTDLEISKALALAIGWPSAVNISTPWGEICVVHTAQLLDKVRLRKGWLKGHRIFDYRDWNVIGPIAEQYRCFPLGTGSQWASRTGTHVCMYADTPQLAIALAVIEGAKT